MEIEIKHGSITEVDVDALVNPANSKGIMGGGVAGFLRKVCGNEVEKEAMERSPIEVGKAITTGAGKLSGKFKGIIHAPTMPAPAMRIPVENVKKATRAALEEAERQGFESIAMPGMGTGVGGVPEEEAARAMINVIKSFGGKKLKKVVLVDISEKMVEAWRKALQEG